MELEMIRVAKRLADVTVGRIKQTQHVLHEVYGLDAKVTRMLCLISISVRSMH